MIADMTEAPKILVINPNTTVEVTERFVAAARLLAPAASIDGVTGTFGAAIVSSEAENLIAGHAVLDLLARHWRGYDAVILAISFDTGLEAARELLPVPVIGITEAMLLAASANGPIGMITFGTVSTPLYRQLVARHGFADRIVGIETIEIDGAASYLSPTDRDGATLAAARNLVAQGAAAIIVCGAALIGAAARLQPSLPIPVFDSLAPAVARALALLRQPPPVVSPPRPISTTSGISPELAALIAGAGFAAAASLAAATSPPPTTSRPPRKDMQ